MGRAIVNKMKTQFLLKDITDVDTLNTGIKLVTEKLASIGIDFTFELSAFNGELNSYTNSYTDTSNQKINFTAVHPSCFSGYLSYGTDNVCLIYDWTKVNPRPTNPVNHGKHIQLPIQFFSTYPEVFAQYFLHELCHDLVPDATHNQSTNTEWSQKSPTDYYLYLLKTYYKQPIKPMPTTIPKYKYFKDSEIVNLNPNLVKILDQAREIAGVPFIISNGFRTPAQNTAIPGSAKNSPHMRGLAADLRCRGSITRSKMLWGLMQFRNILFIEVAGGHLHVDIDAGVHPMGGVIWGDDSN